MGWKRSRFTSSLMSLFGESVPAASAENRVEEVRQAMLDCMSTALKGQAQRPPLWGQVLYAADIQALWYLRSELMSLLSGLCGESEARETLAVVTEMFRGLLPAGQMSRPGRLGR